MLEIILTISFLCAGVHTLTREDCIFSFWQKVVRNQDTLNYRTEMFHPISECLVCMSSFWTCVYLGYLSKIPSINLFYFFSVLVVSIAFCLVEEKILDKAVLFLYLIGVFVFILYTGFGFHGFLVMVAVAGCNRALGAIIKK